MKTSNLIAAAAVVLFAVAGAQAETYEGVQPLTHSRARADVASEGAVAARSGNPYADGAAAGVSAIASSNVDPNVVRAEAVAKAHDPLASLDRRAFYRDTVPSQYTKGSLAVRRQVAQR
ncbi:alpha/beta hydrolase [Variovorax humicola]|uniref:Alpha/beta hydrolase n=1 Tax=Variovorax humicola TaxID=1769758 RepID=A0ABU8W7J9_9BURK